MREGELSLERILWRYRHGRYPEPWLRRVLQDRLGALAGRVRELERQVERLRRLDGGRWRSQDRARTLAVLSLERSSFAECIRSLQSAESDLDHLETSLSVAADLDRVEAAWRHFFVRNDLESWSTLPTLRIPAELARVARELLHSGRPHAARVVTRMLASVIDSLTSRSSGEAPGPEAGLPGIAAFRPSEEVERLRLLLQLGYRELMTRLADDLTARRPAVIDGLDEPPFGNPDLPLRSRRLVQRIEKTCNTEEE